MHDYGHLDMLDKVDRLKDMLGCLGTCKNRNYLNDEEKTFDRHQYDDAELIEFFFDNMRRSKEIENERMNRINAILEEEEDDDDDNEESLQCAKNVMKYLENLRLSQETKLKGVHKESNYFNHVLILGYSGDNDVQMMDKEVIKDIEQNQDDEFKSINNDSNLDYDDFDIDRLRKTREQMKQQIQEPQKNQQLQQQPQFHNHYHSSKTNSEISLSNSSPSTVLF